MLEQVGVVQRVCNHPAEVTMIIVGVVLVAVAVVLTAAAITSNGQHVKFDLWGVLHSSVSVGTVFIAGMITTVVAVLGVLVLVGALRRNRRQRKERKQLAKEESSTPQLETGAIDFTKPIDFNSPRFGKVGGSDASGNTKT
jgi:uncharacterized membrane protein